MQQNSPSHLWSLISPSHWPIAHAIDCFSSEWGMDDSWNRRVRSGTGLIFDTISHHIMARDKDRGRVERWLIARWDDISSITSNCWISTSRSLLILHSSLSSVLDTWVGSTASTRVRVGIGYVMNHGQDNGSCALAAKNLTRSCQCCGREIQNRLHHRIWGLDIPSVLRPYISYPCLLDERKRRLIKERKRRRPK